MKFDVTYTTTTALTLPEPGPEACNGGQTAKAGRATALTHTRRGVTHSAAIYCVGTGITYNLPMARIRVPARAAAHSTSAWARAKR